MLILSLYKYKYLLVYNLNCVYKSNCINISGSIIWTVCVYESHDLKNKGSIHIADLHIDYSADNLFLFYICLHHNQLVYTKFKNTLLKCNFNVHSHNNNPGSSKLYKN